MRLPPHSQLRAHSYLCVGLVTTMFAAAGTLLNISKRAQNQGKVRAGGLRGGEGY